MTSSTSNASTAETTSKTSDSATDNTNSTASNPWRAASLQNQSGALDKNPQADAAAQAHLPTVTDSSQAPTTEQNLDLQPGTVMPSIDISGAENDVTVNESSSSNVRSQQELNVSGRNNTFTVNETNTDSTDNNNTTSSNGTTVNLNGNNNKNVTVNFADTWSSGGSTESTNSSTTSSSGAWDNTTSSTGSGSAKTDTINISGNNDTVTVNGSTGTTSTAGAGDQVITNFQSSDPVLATALSTATTMMSNSGYSQFESAVYKNYASGAYPDDQSLLDAANFQFEQGGASASDIQGAQNAINDTMLQNANEPVSSFGNPVSAPNPDVAQSSSDNMNVNVSGNNDNVTVNAAKGSNPDITVTGSNDTVNVNWTGDSSSSSGTTTSTGSGSTWGGGSDSGSGGGTSSSGWGSGSSSAGSGGGSGAGGSDSSGGGSYPAAPDYSTNAQMVQAQQEMMAGIAVEGQISSNPNNASQYRSQAMADFQTAQTDINQAAKELGLPDVQATNLLLGDSNSSLSMQQQLAQYNGNAPGQGYNELAYDGRLASHEEQVDGSFESNGPQGDIFQQVLMNGQNNGQASVFLDNPQDEEYFLRALTQSIGSDGNINGGFLKQTTADSYYAATGTNIQGLLNQTPTLEANNSANVVYESMPNIQTPNGIQQLTQSSGWSYAQIVDDALFGHAEAFDGTLTNANMSSFLQNANSPTDFTDNPIVTYNSQTQAEENRLLDSADPLQTAENAFLDTIGQSYGINNLAQEAAALNGSSYTPAGWS